MTTPLPTAIQLRTRVVTSSITIRVAYLTNTPYYILYTVLSSAILSSAITTHAHADRLNFQLSGST